MSKISQKINEIEDRLNADPNTPFGLMSRIPEKPISEPLDDQTSIGETETARAEANRFAPFDNNTNPLTGERGGPTGPEPTRYGDWERKGRCSDF